MISVVIIGKNEGKYVDLLINSLPSKWNIWYVADRCTDDTLKKLEKYTNVFPISTINRNFIGRKTSTCRNLGLKSCPIDSDVLFLDGDRYIVSGNIEESLTNSCTDITLLPIECDKRLEEGYDFSKHYGALCNGFFSCGIFFKREVIEAVRNHHLMKGQFFPEFLQEDWGIEDTSLGDLCYSLGFTASLDKKIRLRGSFEKLSFDSLDTIMKRLEFRNKLPNVSWNKILDK